MDTLGTVSLRPFRTGPVVPPTSGRTSSLRVDPNDLGRRVMTTTCRMNASIEEYWKTRPLSRMDSSSTSVFGSRPMSAMSTRPGSAWGGDKEDDESSSSFDDAKKIKDRMLSSSVWFGPPTSSFLQDLE
eukprot:TRINITY_DN2421_c0_g1_i1.p1 TRINITY_DN2421_c0_g1~~TRINITY_DN2421_c0_g1_i1.p1  ORF type:complete len:151 (-),score=40.93 TRINITY_DN2421_c0_g1_i1:134-520(-)